jgi:hypothetical protein
LTRRKTILFSMLSLLMLSQLAWPASRTSSLLAGYRFEESAAATATDMSGNARTGTATGTTIVTGKLGKGRSFNGTSDKIAIADNAVLRLTTAFTIAAWVKPGALPAASSLMVLVEKDDTSGNANYSLTIDNAGNCASGPSWSIWFQNAAAAAFTNCFPTTITVGTWYHVVGTWDNTNLKLYTNGVLQSTVNQAGKVPTTGTGVLMIGNEAGNAFWYNGALDEVRVYNRALTASEVRSLMLGYEPKEF